jgi:hypothetical protein
MLKTLPLDQYKEDLISKYNLKKDFLSKKGAVVVVIVW